MKSAFFYRSIQLLIAGILFFTSVSAFAEDVVIICNKNAPDAVMTGDDVKDIFLGKKSKWSDGTKIEFATHQNADVHQNFLKTYIGRTTSQFRNYWKKEVFTGKGRMPKTVNDDQQMIQFVMATSGAVGYISSKTPANSVNVVTIK